MPRTHIKAWWAWCPACNSSTQKVETGNPLSKQTSYSSQNGDQALGSVDSFSMNKMKSIRLPMSALGLYTDTLLTCTHLFRPGHLVFAFALGSQSSFLEYQSVWTLRSLKTLTLAINPTSLLIWPLLYCATFFKWQGDHFNTKERKECDLGNNIIILDTSPWIRHCPAFWAVWTVDR